MFHIHYLLMFINFEHYTIYDYFFKVFFIQRLPAAEVCLFSAKSHRPEP